MRRAVFSKRCPCFELTDLRPLLFSPLPEPRSRQLSSLQKARPSSVMAQVGPLPAGAGGDGGCQSRSGTCVLPAGASWSDPGQCLPVKLLLCSKRTLIAP